MQGSQKSYCTLSNHFHHLQVRWVTSHKSALERIWRNHKMMMLHLDTIITRTAEFTESTRDKARDLKNYFLSSTTMLLINFNLDVMQEFSRQSLIFQINDQSSKHRKSCLYKIQKLIFVSSHWSGQI